MTTNKVNEKKIEAQVIRLCKIGQAYARYARLECSDGRRFAALGHAGVRTALLFARDIKGRSAWIINSLVATSVVRS